MPEWTIGTVSKTVVPLRVPRVRIPLFPQKTRDFANQRQSPFLYPNDKCRKIGYLPIKFVACLSAVKQTLIVFFSTGQILYLIHTANLYLRISFMKYIQFILKNRKVIFH